MNSLARASMLTLFGAVVLVLLVASANVAGLLLARGTTRQREAAIRASLGAGRTRLVRLLLTESLLLSAMGGILGLFVAWLGVDLLGTWLSEAVGTTGGRGLEYLDPTTLGLNGRVLVFAIGVTGGTGILFGLLPAWRSSRPDLIPFLKDGSGTVGADRTARGLMGRTALVASQVALALVLLVGAGLMMKSLARIHDVELGYDPDNVLTANYSLSEADVASGIDPSSFHAELVDRIRELPGVEGATAGTVPMGGPSFHTLVMGVEGRPEITPESNLRIRVQPVADGHLEVMGARLLQGRDIRRIDRSDATKVAVVNRTAAERLVSGGDVLGRRIRLGWKGFDEEGAEIVGVVEDMQYGSPDQPAEMQAFLSLRQVGRQSTGIIVRAAGDPGRLAPRLRSTLADMNPNLALTSVMTLEERTSRVTAQPRVVSLLLGIFAAVAVLLAATGLYGVVAFSVAGRTRELGLRVALGADRGDLVGMVLKQGVLMTLVGVAVGLPAAWYGTRFLEGLLYRVEPLDPLTFAAVPVLLLLVALAAAYLPARRATRVDPMVALRTE